MILASSCGHLKFFSSLFLSILLWTLLDINEVHSSPVNLGQDTELWDEEPIQISAKVTRIGCLFAKEICDENSEWCFNDNAFGRCLPAFGLVNDEALYRYDLDKDQTKFLENQMEKLFVDGHRWRHAYTQCSLQNTLDNFKFGSNYEPKSCDGEKLEELEGALIALEDELDPLSLALIRFRPSEISEQPDWAEELYVPGLEPQEYAAESPIFQPKNDEDLRQAIQMAQTKNSQPKSKMTPDEEKFLEEALENLVNELEENDSQKNRKFKALKTANSAALMGNFDKKSDSIFFDLPSDLEMEELEKVLEPKIFTGIYNSPDTFRHGLETRDVMNVLNSDINGDENNQDNNFMMADQPIENSAEDLYNEDNDSIGDLISGEEGLAFLQKSENNEDDETMGSDEARYLLQELVSPPSGLSARSLYGNGFERQERLDVKKPGPWFRNVNNYGNFDYEEPEVLDASQSGTQEEVDLNPEFESAIEPAELLRFSLPQGEKEIEEDLKPQNKMVNSPDETKKPREKPQPEINSKAALLTAMKKSGQNINDVDIIESAYVHLVLNTEITEWMLARKIVEIVADQLNVERVYFTEIRFNKNIITFRVIQPNNMGINSSQISERIEKFNSAENILRGSDIKIVKAGVGKSPNVIWEYLARESFGFYNNGIFFWTFMASGLVAAVVLSGFGIYYIRKNAKSKDKFSRIATDDPTGEACKDYQELCRARMATKAQVGPSPVRSGSFKKEGNVTKSPNSSTRSSSSSNSWSEEPVQSHMDISTGHMVLAYMEDHLKKKDRLDQEWAALCGYEAEPNATTIAQKSENAKKNRYTNALPYDHSRVILNELANLNSADYINASTITDHDPRNPAYIATQGPLSNTVADFWQMVWEQGSVVIVALTRLAENGNQLCHRYWPEEGSELHHIYEVHLVSEHIWCDEYLVRSFYLKNLKTAETRTVTQFNFLAWPENGIPSNMKALLEFRRKVNKSYRGRSCPIIVHCSDGAGRSGTYCLIDMVLNRMSKGAKEIDIAASLEHIRDQRPGMVKTKQQFEFVLMSVAEEVHAILKALPQ